MLDFIKSPLAVDIDVGYLNTLRKEIHDCAANRNQAQLSMLIQLNQATMLLRLLLANIQTILKCRLELKDLLSPADYASLFDETVPAIETIVEKAKNEMKRLARGATDEVSQEYAWNANIE